METRTDKGIAAIHLVEESLHVLRRLPAGILAAYYLGALPFILGLLYFWADMTRGAFAVERCTLASLGLALLFVWMKTWQSVFFQAVKARAGGPGHHDLSSGRLLRLAGIQALIQGTGLVLIPLSLLLAVPFGWVFAFYQNALLPEQGKSPTLQGTIRGALARTRPWPVQNHFALAIFVFLGGILFINMGFTLFIIPHLLKSLLGLETIYTISGIHLLNTTYLAVVAGLSYLLLDPLVKTLYALRCFYADSVRTGEDLLSELRRLKSAAGTGKALTCVLLLAATLLTASAGTALCETAPGQNMPLPAPAVSAESLDTAIQEVLKRKEFTWRMPRIETEREKTGIKGPLATAADWLAGAIGGGIRTLAGWVKSLFQWVAGLLPKPAPLPEDSGEGPGRPSSYRSLFIGLIVLLVFALVFFVVRTVWTRKHRPGVLAMESAGAFPDLASEPVTASDLPQEGWISLAREMMEKGAMREALRAVYMATLAGLAQGGVITPAKHKSNREYRDEVKRRAHGNIELFGLFTANMDLFDRAWYGRFKPTKEDLKGFLRNHERISTLVLV